MLPLSSSRRSPEVRRRALNAAVLGQMKQVDHLHSCPSCKGPVESVMGKAGPHRQCTKCFWGHQEK